MLCSLCENICAHMHFSITKLSNKKVFNVELSGFTQQLMTSVSEMEYFQLQQHYQNGDSEKLYATDIEFAPYYCPNCNLNYCSQHWHIQITYDEGYYDAETGTCPKGHKKMLFD